MIRCLTLLLICKKYNFIEIIVIFGIPKYGLWELQPQKKNLSIGFLI